MNPWDRHTFLRDAGLRRPAGEGLLTPNPGSDSFVRETAAQWEPEDGGSDELDRDLVAATFVPPTERIGDESLDVHSQDDRADDRWPDHRRARTPQLGEDLAGFRILAVLGHGAEGFVYLATQKDLSDRPVVLKLSSIQGAEHRSLARLQHTHIVPILSAQDLPELGMRMICLPYMGGTTLERVLEDLRRTPPPDRTGRDILDIIDGDADSAPLTLGTEGPAREFFTLESYDRVIAWIGLCLAEALHHAHRRNLVHWDVKPANILLAADAMPLLLDFHLAQPPVDASGVAPQRLGGTPPYLAPEQFEAMVAATERRPLPSIDARADIYALAMVLHVALAGTPPLGQVGIAARLRQANPRVSPGLAAIIERGLATGPLERYGSADRLAEDLRKHLEDAPLKWVKNRSLSEGWVKWQKHHPVALARAGALVTAGIALVLAGIIAWSSASRRLGEAVANLEQGELQLAAGGHRQAALSFNRGLALLDARPRLDRLVPSAREARRRLAAARERNRRLQVAEELHDVVERARFLYAGSSSTGAKAWSLESRLEEIWAARSVIRRELTREADGAPRSRLDTDLLDLSILWTNLRVDLAGDERARAEAHRGALQTLASSAAEWGPSAVLAEEQRYHAEALGRGDPSPAGPPPPEPGTAWENYALGRALLRRGALEQAAHVLDRAVALEPNNLWAQFHRGQCALRRRRYEEAVDAFGACVALAPQAVCYYNRSLAYSGLGAQERARQDLDQARQLDPRLLAGPPMSRHPSPPR